MFVHNLDLCSLASRKGGRVKCDGFGRFLLPPSKAGCPLPCHHCPSPSSSHPFGTCRTQITFSASKCLKLFLYLLPQARLLPCPSPDTYLVLLDAGSVHTSIYTYRWLIERFSCVIFQWSSSMMLLLTG